MLGGWFSGGRKKETLAAASVLTESDLPGLSARHDPAAKVAVVNATTSVASPEPTTLAKTTVALDSNAALATSSLPATAALPSSIEPIPGPAKRSGWNMKRPGRAAGATSSAADHSAAARRDSAAAQAGATDIGPSAGTGDAAGSARFLYVCELRLHGAADQLRAGGAGGSGPAAAPLGPPEALVLNPEVFRGWQAGDYVALRALGGPAAASPPPAPAPPPAVAAAAGGGGSADAAGSGAATEGPGCAAGPHARASDDGTYARAFESLLADLQRLRGPAASGSPEQPWHCFRLESMAPLRAGAAAASLRLGVAEALRLPQRCSVQVRSMLGGGGMRSAAYPHHPCTSHPPLSPTRSCASRGAPQTRRAPLGCGTPSSPSGAPTRAAAACGGCGAACSARASAPGRACARAGCTCTCATSGRGAPGEARGAPGRLRSLVS